MSSCVNLTPFFTAELGEKGLLEKIKPYHADINRFCFRAGGRYFTGLRSVTTPRKELERQMDNHYRKQNR